MRTAPLLLSRVMMLAATSAALVAGTGGAQALVNVQIDLTHQRMHVTSNEGDFDWPISSARSGFYTPGGSFAPTHMELMHYSKKYHMSPMPHAIFFRGGYAIHGTYETGSLGRPASHGCVRLSPGNAATLYAMVKAEGARIGISGTPPASRLFRVARHRSRSNYDYATGTPEQSYGDAGYASAGDGYGYTYSRRTRPAYYGQVGGYGYTYAPQTYYGSGATPGFPDFGQ